MAQRHLARSGRRQRPRAARADLARIHRRDNCIFAEMLDAAKRRVVDTMLASEFTVLSLALARIAAGHFSTRDYTLNRLREALAALCARVSGLSHLCHRRRRLGRRPRDHRSDRLRARARAGSAPTRKFSTFCAAPSRSISRSDPGYSAPRVRNFALKLQQFTGPLMAKAMEDTLFYRDHRLLAFNEVGGHPDAHALPLDRLSCAPAATRRNRARQPHGHRHARHQTRRRRARPHSRTVGNCRTNGTQRSRNGESCNARSDPPHTTASAGRAQRTNT